MQETFYQLADFLTSKLEGDEVLTMLYAGEDSDFVRFNKSKIRQAGAVKQSSVSLELILGRRHVTASTTLTQDTEQDRAQTLSILQDLRSKLPELPEDPHLLYATEVCSSEEHGENTLPSASEVTDEILTAGQGHDLVGIYAAGGIFEGFANSLGQRNWFSNYNFNFDWSNYLVADKAVKSGYAGTSWNSADFQVKVDAAAKQLKALARDSISIDPGRYRVYLAPAAVFDFLGMLGWGAFGLKDQRT
ncbi:MAG: putative Zn-dependent protease, partial [Planctomycetota bacterium]